MRRLCFGVLVLGLIVAMAGPAAAGNHSVDPPATIERFEAPFFVSYFDDADGLIALGGPPAEQGCNDEGFDDNLANIQEIRLPNGVIVSLVKDPDMPIWVYAASSIEEICMAVDEGEPLDLVASGTVRLVLHDNDLEASATPGGTRTNSFGDHASGRLTTPDGGSCQFSAIFHGQVNRDDEFRLIKEDVTLRC